MFIYFMPFLRGSEDKAVEKGKMFKNNGKMMKHEVSAVPNELADTPNELEV